MTLRPDTGQTKARPDLPEYLLGWKCMVEGCEEGREGGGGHHVFRRSLGPSYRDAWWVELEDGTLVPNRVGLCPEHHKAVTGGVGGHTARIGLESDRLLWQVLFNGVVVTTVRLVFETDPFDSLLPRDYWAEDVTIPRLHDQGTADVLELLDDMGVQPHHEIDIHEPGHIWSAPETHDHAEIEPGTKCPTCNRRVNHKKKKDSPESTKVFSVRAPLDLASDLDELWEPVAAQYGIDPKEKYFKAKVMLACFAEALQRKRIEIKRGQEGRGA